MKDLKYLLLDSEILEENEIDILVNRGVNIIELWIMIYK